MSAKHKPHQVEIAWADPEPFALAIEHTQDGERTAREQQQREQDRKASESHQLALVP